MNPMENEAYLRSLIHGGRKASLEEILVRLNKLLEIESFTDAQKLEKLKEAIERDLRSLP